MAAAAATTITAMSAQVERRNEFVVGRTEPMVLVAEFLLPKVSLLPAGRACPALQPPPPPPPPRPEPPPPPHQATAGGVSAVGTAAVAAAAAAAARRQPSRDGARASAVAAPAYPSRSPLGQPSSFPSAAAAGAGFGKYSTHPKALRDRFDAMRAALRLQVKDLHHDHDHGQGQGHRHGHGDGATAGSHRAAAASPLASAAAAAAAVVVGRSAVTENGGFGVDERWAAAALAALVHRDAAAALEAKAALAATERSIVPLERARFFSVGIPALSAQRGGANDSMTKHAAARFLQKVREVATPPPRFLALHSCFLCCRLYYLRFGALMCACVI